MSDGCGAKRAIHVASRCRDCATSLCMAPFWALGDQVDVDAPFWSLKVDELWDIEPANAPTMPSSSASLSSRLCEPGELRSFMRLRSMMYLLGFRTANNGLIKKKGAGTVLQFRNDDLAHVHCRLRRRGRGLAAGHGVQLGFSEFTSFIRAIVVPDLSPSVLNRMRPPHPSLMSSMDSSDGRVPWVTGKALPFSPNERVSVDRPRGHLRSGPQHIPQVQCRATQRRARPSPSKIRDLAPRQGSSHPC
jgi:hypothetical protein